MTPPADDRRRVLAALLVVLPALRARADDPPALSLADLAGYRAALIAGKTDTPPPSLGYRALWDHPERYRGRRVQVEGRIVRRFRQGAFGTFPPLVEAWAVTPAGEPFCWVYPETKDPGPSATSQARFVGTFLRQIRYQGADVPRLAPLIVGPAAPVVPAARHAPSRVPGARFSWVEWALGAAAAAVVAVVLAWQHARKPLSRTSLDERGPPPSFASGPDDLPAESSGGGRGQDTSQDEGEQLRPIV